MMGENSSSAEMGMRITSGVYHGMKEGSLGYKRGVKMCEEEWNMDEKMRIGKFDDLVHEQLEKAQREGRNEVVVLDIGSGQAELFRDALDKPSLIAKTAAFLSAHPDLRVRMIGLTDSPSPDYFLHYVSIPSKIYNVEALNVFYSLTRGQPLGEFLRSGGVSKVDLALATWSLTYLGPETFRGVMEDAVSYLREGGGRMIAAGYASDKYMPGIRVPVAWAGNKILDMRGDATPFKQTLYYGSKRFLNLKRDLSAEEADLGDVEEKFIEKGVLSEVEVKRAKLIGRLIGVLSKRAGLTVRAMDTNVAVGRLIERQTNRIMGKKREVLEGLKERYEQIAKVSFTPRTLCVVKI